MTPEQIVLNLASTVGSYYADPQENLPANVTINDLDKFLATVITEFDSGYKLKRSSWKLMKSDISKYFQDVEDKKTTLFASMEEEALAEVVSGAAGVASAFLSEFPGLNLGLIGTMMLAQGSEMFLERRIALLEKTIVEDLVGSQKKLSSKDSFKYCEVYTDAVHKNTIMYARLNLATSNDRVRAMFLGAVFCTKKRYKECNVEQLKELFINFYHATKADPELVNKYSALLHSIKHIEDPKKIKIQLDSFFGRFADKVRISVAWTCNMFIFAMGVKAYKVSRNAAVARQRAANLATGDVLEEPINNINEDGEAVPVVEEDNLEREVPAAIEGEVANTVGKLGVCIKSIGALASVLVIVVGILTSIKGFEVKSKLEEQIRKVEKELEAYYTKLVHTAIE